MIMNPDLMDECWWRFTFWMMGLCESYSDQKLRLMTVQISMAHIVRLAKAMEKRSKNTEIEMERDILEAVLSLVKPYIAGRVVQLEFPSYPLIKTSIGDAVQLMSWTLDATARIVRVASKLSE